MADIKVVGKLSRPKCESAKVYRLAAPQVSERSLRALARGFGMTGKGGSVSSDKDRLVLREADLELAVHRASGGLRFRDVARWQRDDGEDDFEMSDRQAHGRAMKIADAFGLAVKETRFLKAARLRVGEAKLGSKEYQERTIDVAVALQRVIGDIPVDGPGGKIVIYLDREGKPTGAERIWRELAGVAGEGRIVPPQSAIEDLERRLRTKRGMVEVSDVRMGYFEGGWRHRQRILQPAYVVIGEATMPGSRVRRKVVHVAPALAQPFDELTPPSKRKPPQPPRSQPKGR